MHAAARKTRIHGVMGFLVLLALLAGPLAAVAQTSSQDGPGAVEVRKLAENLFLLSDGRQQTSVFITDLGVVVVDPGSAETGPSVRAAIQRLTSKPVITLIDSHSHADHTDGNMLFGTTVDIVAHEQTRRNMEKATAFGSEGINFLPKLMFRNRMSLGTGAGRIDLHYFGRGHTNGDVWVFFPALGVAYAGDMFPGRELPIIDGSQGGSGLEYPASMERAADALRGIDVIVTGHSGPLTRADFDDFRALTREFNDIVIDGFNRGMSVDDVIASWNTNAPARFPAAPAERVRSNVEYMFGELAPIEGAAR
jgi:glyoxylase-like metal-dependent hydrolase (beta-lactamase superfamily II)